MARLPLEPNLYDDYFLFLLCIDRGYSFAAIFSQCYRFSVFLVAVKYGNDKETSTVCPDIHKMNSLTYSGMNHQIADVRGDGVFIGGRRGFKKFRVQYFGLLRKNIVVFNQQVDVTGYYYNSPSMETDMVPEIPASEHLNVSQGKKSYVKIPRKLNTSIAYLFALIKPCGVHGDGDKEYGQFPEDPDSVDLKNERRNDEFSRPLLSPVCRCLFVCWEEDILADVILSHELEIVLVLLPWKLITGGHKSLPALLIVQVKKHYLGAMLIDLSRLEPQK
ncbi:hypothetical protein OPV22_000006 [Ensete ventricosum]|uniref:Uncharacterized protein n=1 Tax=Ensete ventricosum TaxID=4639 RepID=A0AAV8RUW3_ENSVE|nr:hypothetical protein OPV22_000006 [Ensete ventricosum]